MLADDPQRFLIAVAVSAHNAVLHLFCLGCHAVLPQCPACKTDEIENIAVLPDKGAGRPFVFLFQRYRSFLPERLGGVRPMVFWSVIIGIPSLLAWWISSHIPSVQIGP